jgi:hypothetical protein
MYTPKKQDKLQPLQQLSSSFLASSQKSQASNSSSDILSRYFRSATERTILTSTLLNLFQNLRVQTQACAADFNLRAQNRVTDTFLYMKCYPATLPGNITSNVTKKGGGSPQSR